MAKNRRLNIHLILSDQEFGRFNQKFFIWQITNTGNGKMSCCWHLHFCTAHRLLSSFFYSAALTFSVAKPTNIFAFFFHRPRVFLSQSFFFTRSVIMLNFNYVSRWKQRMPRVKFFWRNGNYLVQSENCITSQLGLKFCWSKSSSS